MTDKYEGINDSGEYFPAHTTGDLFELDCLIRRVEELEKRLESLEALGKAAQIGVIDRESLGNFVLNARCAEPDRYGPSAEFNEFWAAYPRKKDCKKAWAAWQKCKNRPAIEEILDAIKAQKKSEQWQRGIIPLPSTWINNERFDDEI